MRTLLSVSVYMYICVYESAFICVCARGCVRACMCLCIYVFVYVCMCVSICVSVL